MGKKWMRVCGRLVRTSENEDVRILKVDATKAINSMIVQNELIEKPKARQPSQNFSLLSLPLEIFLIITTYLDVKDVENLGTTCEDLSNLVRRVFVPKVVLPLSAQNMELLEGPNGRFVLSLCSTINIRLLGLKGEFESMLKRNMNLKYLKEIKFIGNNYYYNNDDVGGGLIPAYKSVMRNIFLTKHFVRKLDISFDNSEECFKQLQGLKKMLFLEELSLRSSDFRPQFNEMLYEERNLNEILRGTLRDLKIRSLELKIMTMGRDQFGGSGVYGIQIFSKSIQMLKLQFGKNCQLSAIEAEKLKEIVIMTESVYSIYYHAQLPLQRLWDCRELFPGNLRSILAQGCPNLEKYNDMDLTILGKNRAWLTELQYHKGE